MTDDQDLYTRQEELDTDIPDTAAVIGVGGVGSWVSLDLALAGVSTIHVIDPDHIERHNLNRTPFKETQIGDDKATAVAELVAERRINAEVIPHPRRVEEVAGFDDELDDAIIVDCRDHVEPMPEPFDQPFIKTGYDGLEYTLHLHPDYEALWGEGTDEYQTVPSFVAPPQFMASIVTTLVCTPHDHTDEKITSSNMNDLITHMFER